MKKTIFKQKRCSLTACKIMLVAVVMFSSVSLVQAQVTIGSGEPPHNDALLDLKENSAGSSTKGLLLPRVSLEATNVAIPLTVHEKGMTVYNIGTSLASVDPKYYLSPGFYYNDGTQWVRLNYSYTKELS